MPKGQVDLGESNWDAAIREVFEESGIVIGKSDIISGPMNDSWLTMWLAEIPWGMAVTIGKNPTTGHVQLNLAGAINNPVQQYVGRVADQTRDQDRQENRHPAPAGRRKEQPAVRCDADGRSLADGQVEFDIAEKSHTGWTS